MKCPQCGLVVLRQAEMPETIKPLTISERMKARKVAANPIEAPITLDMICLLSLALREAEAETSQAWKDNYERKVANAAR